MVMMKHENKLLCRVCLHCDFDDVPSSNIFNKNSKGFIYEKLNSIAELHIKPGDGLPKNICAECLLELENAINFKQKCETSNSILVSASNVTAELKGKETSVEDIKEEPDDYTELDYLEEEPVSTPDQVSEQNEYKKEPASTPEQVSDPNESKEEQQQLEIQIQLPFKPSRAKDLKLGCHDCGNIFKSKCKLKVHWFKTHLKAQLTCNICEHTFGSFKKLKDHMVNRTQRCTTLSQVNITGAGKARVLHCRECKHTTSIVKNMTKHLAKHVGQVQEYQCKLCPKKYAYNISLKKHMETDHEAKKVKKTCIKCGEVVLGMVKYRQHLLYHRNVSVTCNICKKNIKKHSYKQHLAVHTDKKNYICDLCGASFKWQSGLYTHRNEFHRKVIKFDCDRCGYSISSQSKMSSHRRKHTDHEDFACNLCGKFLLNKQQLSLHKKQHIARRNKCPQCNETFFRLISLKEHINKQHPEKEELLLDKLVQIASQIKRFDKIYKCHQCERIYTRKSSLDKHIIRVH